MDSWFANENHIRDWLNCTPHSQVVLRVGLRYNSVHHGRPYYIMWSAVYIVNAFGTSTVKATRRQGSRWRYDRIFIGIILCCLGVYGLYDSDMLIDSYLKAYWWLMEGVEIDYQVEDIASRDAVENQLGLRQSTIEEQCSKTTGRCWRVVDRLIEDNLGSYAERCLFMQGFEDESDSSIRIIPPAGTSSLAEIFSSSDSRFWQIDHTQITAQYVAALAIAPFVFGTFKMDDKKEKRSLLEIGLGGGTYAGFMRHHRPNLNITSVELDETVIYLADKWFGFKQSPLLHVHAADGIVFVEKAARRGEAWDVVLVDACDGSQIIPCPAHVFLNDVFMADVRKVVKDQGLLIVNILDLHENAANIAGVSKQFASHFPTCATLHMNYEINVILVCLPYQIGDADAQLRFFESRIPHVVEQLGLKKLLPHVVISAPYSSR
ncbi:unnamed protein product, partial [Mesorhabditis spiculigera]